MDMFLQVAQGLLNIICRNYNLGILPSPALINIYIVIILKLFIGFHPLKTICGHDNWGYRWGWG